MILDGVKLFAKSSYELHLRKTMSLFFISLMLIATLLISVLFCPLVGVKYFNATKVVEAFAYLMVVEIFEFFAYSVTANHFVSAAILRAIALACITEIT